MMRTTIALVLLAAGVGTAEEVRRDLYGDPLPPGAVMRLGTVRWRHDGCTVADVAYSPDGKRLATCGGDKLVRLWDSKTGAEVRRLIGHSYRPVALAFSPDGKLLASGDREKSIRLWDVATGKTLQRIKERHSVASLVFCRDGKRLVSSSSDEYIHVWDVASGKCFYTLEGHSGGEIALSISANGQWLASSTGWRDNMIYLWDLATGRLVRKIGPHKKPVPQVQFAPDGATLAASDADGTIHLWDVATGRQVRQWKADNYEIPVLLFTPDGRTLLSGSEDGFIRQWETVSGKEVRLVAQCLHSICAMSVSPYGKTLASVAHGDSVVRRWNLHSGKEITLHRGHEEAINAVQFAADGRTILSTAEDGAARIWDRASGKELHCLREKDPGMFPPRIALSADSQTLAVASGEVVCLRNRITGKTLATFPTADTVKRLRFSPDGKILAVGTGDEIVHVWDVRAGKERCQMEGDYFLVFSADSRFLAVPDADTLTHSDGGIQIWDSASGKGVRYLPRPDKDSRLFPLGFSADGRMLVGCHLREEKNAPQRSALVVWELATGRERFRGRMAEGKLFAAAFSPDGSTLAVGSVKQIIQIWDVRTGAERPCFRGAQGDIRALAFSKDGRWLASGGEDTTILLWPAIAPPMPPRSTRELSAKELQARWSDLLGQDAVRAFKAMQAMYESPTSTVAFLRERLRPVTTPDADAVQRLLADLDSDNFAVRERATKELEKLVDAVEPLLRQALKDKPSLERRVRLQRLLEMLGADSPEHLRQSRALEVLEWLNTAKSRKLLDRLAGGAADAWLTREAKATATRLERWNRSRP